MPYIVHESSLARMERVQRRFTLLLLVELAALIVSNVYWLVRILGEHGQENPLSGNLPVQTFRGQHDDPLRRDGRCGGTAPVFSRRFRLQDSPGEILLS